MIHVSGGVTHRVFRSRPVISAPKGMELAPIFMPKTLYRYVKETRNTPARPLAFQFRLSIASFRSYLVNMSAYCHMH